MTIKENRDYEYAVLQARVSDNHEYRNRLVWGTLQEAEEELRLFDLASGYFSYRLVKRRKAGEIEDA